MRFIAQDETNTIPDVERRDLFLDHARPFVV
jgi:hypothetical protein